MSEFSRIITLLRKEKGITQKQAAEQLGVSQALLSHYEKDVYKRQILLRAGGQFDGGNKNDF